MTWLHIAGNRIADIGALTHMTQLEELDAGSNRISDIRPLAGMTKLKRLNLSHNAIQDINPLVNMPNLDELYLHDNLIADLQPLVLHAHQSKTRLIDARVVLHPVNVYVYNNPLSEISRHAHIPELRRRNVTIDAVGYPARDRLDCEESLW